MSSDDFLEGRNDASSETASLLDGVSNGASNKTPPWTSSWTYDSLKGTLTLRGIVVGLIIGVLICLSNVYFGLQTGVINGMSLPSSVLGFAIFKAISRYLKHPLTSSENVFIETVAGAVGCMPLGAGLLTVIPALEKLLKPEENGPLSISWAQLLLWSVGLCFFGLIFAMPLREQFVVREKLPFPSSTATAIVIKTLHEKRGSKPGDVTMSDVEPRYEDIERNKSYLAGVKAMMVAFCGSGIFTVIAYFIPILHQVPLFGLSASTRWFWNINISPAFVGQGIITGLAISAHMMLGAIVGWGVLSPLAKAEGWAPGEPADWETGSRGWTVWVSVAALLADCFVKLFWYGGRLVVRYGRSTLNTLWQYLRGKPVSKTTNYSPIPQNDAEASQSQDEADAEETADMDHTLNNPPQNSVQSSTNTPDPPYSSLIPFQITLLALLLSITFCIVSIKFTLGPFMPVWTLLLAILLAMLFSIMAVQSVGETDINPVGAIGKISQFAFALLIPLSHPHALLINLIAGGIAEAGTNQAGDLIYDLKTGHLLNVPPDALFMGQLIGSAFGALVSVAFYRLYSFVYPIPGDMFPVPAAYVWITTSRLVLGEGLPEKAGVFSIAAAAIFALTTTVKLGYADRWWQYLIPSGVAFSIGMYNVPSLAISRFVGGLIYYFWHNYLRRDKNTILLLASGLILGEALLSLVNLALFAAKVPHLNAM